MPVVDRTFTLIFEGISCVNFTSRHPLIVRVTYKLFQTIYCLFTKDKAEKNVTIPTIVAIDDLKLQDGPCGAHGACDFDEYDLCSWSNVEDSRDKFDWSLGSTRPNLLKTGPKFDHTKNDSTGVFLYADGRSPILPGYNAYLESTLFYPTPSFGLCMDFWYHMYGRHIGTLNVHLSVSSPSSDTESVLIWSRSGNKGDQWLNGQVSIKSSRSFRLSFEAIRGNGDLSTIAIDDIDFTERACMSDLIEQSTPSTSTPLSNVTRKTPPVIKPKNKCDFEEGLGIWQQNPQNEGTINWLRVQGQLGDENAGPISVDHSLGEPNGWYILAIFNETKYEDAVRLETDIQFGQSCLEFYYYFVTDSTFRFDVLVRNENETDAPLWTKTTSQGKLWKLGRVTVDSKRFKNFNVVLELKHLISVRPEDILALDDLVLNDGVCRDSSDINQVCMFSNPNDMCGYTIDPNPFSWKLYVPVAGDEESSRPLPIYDHTTGDFGSGYVYADATGFNQRDQTIMKSPLYEADGVATERCLEFYFYLVGDSINLSAKLLRESASSYLWTRDYDHGTGWWKANVNMKYGFDYRIGFGVEILGKNSTGSKTAIDDILLRDGICSR